MRVQEREALISGSNFTGTEFAIRGLVGEPKQKPEETTFQKYLSARHIKRHDSLPLVAPGTDFEMDLPDSPVSPGRRYLSIPTYNKQHKKG